MTRTYRIEQDTDSLDPTKEFDQLGKIVTWHRRYNLGHEQPTESPEEWRAEHDNKHFLVLPVYLYDHSILSISTHSFVGRAQHAEWDSGQVGYIYVSHADIRKEYGRLNIRKATTLLQAEIETYDDYLTGNVWGYIVEDENGNHVESCWGFYGNEGRAEAEREAQTYL